MQDETVNSTEVSTILSCCFGAYRERPTKIHKQKSGFFPDYAGTPDDCMRILGDLVNGLDSYWV